MKVPLLWFKSESNPRDVMLPTWSYEWLMLNSTSLWEQALLMVSIRTAKSLLGKLLKLNSLNSSRLSGYCEEFTTYFCSIKHNSDGVFLKVFRVDCCRDYADLEKSCILHITVVSAHCYLSQPPAFLYCSAIFGLNTRWCLQYRIKYCSSLDLCKIVI